jgi:hypothetical protein
MTTLGELEYLKTYINEEGELVLIAGALSLDSGIMGYRGTRKRLDADPDEPTSTAFYDKSGIVQREPSDTKGGNIVKLSDTPWHVKEQPAS